MGIFGKLPKRIRDVEPITAVRLASRPFCSRHFT
jgi:hypothetical protein